MMNGSSRIVELHQAFFWTCEDCGRDNFARAVQLAPEAIDQLELPLQARESYAAAAESAEATDVELDGAFFIAPSSVKCSDCGAEFGTVDED